MVEEAIARCRARWSHPPIDVVDVEERVAVRLDAGEDRLVRVLAFPPAVRIFVEHAGGRWRSAYVHHLEEVDAVLERLLRPAPKKKHRSVSRPIAAASEAP